MSVRLRNPCICEIYDVFSLDHSGHRCVVMEWVDGNTLHDMRALRLDELIAIALQSAEALAYAHTQPEEVLHRDIKPSQAAAPSDVTDRLHGIGSSLFANTGPICLPIGIHSCASSKNYCRKSPQPDTHPLGTWPPPFSMRKTHWPCVPCSMMPMSCLSSSGTILPAAHAAVLTISFLLAPLSADPVRQRLPLK